MKAIVYPRLLNLNYPYQNPYVNDFIQALEEQEVEVVNMLHKNPLFSLVFKHTKEDRLKVFTFHSFTEIESIVRKHRLEEIGSIGYKQFFAENSWSNFGLQFVNLLKK